jgi:hypothetical protein
VDTAEDVTSVVTSVGLVAVAGKMAAMKRRVPLQRMIRQRAKASHGNVDDRTAGVAQTKMAKGQRMVRRGTEMVNAGSHSQNVIRGVVVDSHRAEGSVHKMVAKRAIAKDAMVEMVKTAPG